MPTTTRTTATLLAALLLAQTQIATSAPARAQATRLRGVNISGAELNPGKPNARPNFDDVWPNRAELDWAASHRMTAIRLPVEWSRLQPALGAAIDQAEWARVTTILHLAQARRIRLILDLHDYGAWRGRLIGSPALPNALFADTWRRIAILARPEPDLILGLMNEPNRQTSTEWEASAQAALDAIRATGARNLVLVSGTGWDGAHSWTAGHPSNATAMEQLRIPPSGPVAFEMHQYVDHDFSGTHPDCLAPSDAIRTLAPATAWLAAHHRHGFLGEFAATGTKDCLATLDAMLTYLDAHPDQWIGWTYWAAGAWWGHYPFSVEPQRGPDGRQVEAPQMAILDRHLR